WLTALQKSSQLIIEGYSSRPPTGMRKMKPRYRRLKPMVSPKPGMTLRFLVAVDMFTSKCSRALASGLASIKQLVYPTAALLRQPGPCASALGQTLQNAVELATVVEMIVLCLLPAAKHVIDTEQLNIDELVGKLPGDLRVARAVVVGRGNPLGVLTLQVLEVRRGNLTGALAVDVLVHHGHRRFGENAHRGQHALELTLAQPLHRQVGLVLPGNEDITQSTLHEGIGRAKIGRAHV